jgi:hypothetical protein
MTASSSAAAIALLQRTPAASLQMEVATARVAELGTSAVVGGTRVSATEWRNTPALHASLWLCHRCQRVMSIASEPTCVVCGV